MNFRLPAFALLTFLLALSQAYGQASGASYQQSISQAATALTVNSSSSVVGLESPPTLSAVIPSPTVARRPATSLLPWRMEAL